jgi:purine-nucleoside phosphorylase
MIPPTRRIEHQLKKSLNFIKNYTRVNPEIGVILGSGLGNFTQKLKDRIEIPTSQIPYYPRSTVEGHRGFFVFGQLQTIPVLVIQGRTHLYEGYTVQEVAYGVRLMSKIGIKFLLVTNAAGGINRHFEPGDLMIITDHINFLFRNPLFGPVVDGENRRPDLYNAYDSDYINLIEKTGMELKIKLQRGVLFVSAGPSYETPAEIRMIEKLGGDAVSMSTVPEVLAARAGGIKIAGISCITNLASGKTPTPLSHKEVTHMAYSAAAKFQNLLEAVLIKIGSKLQVK